MRPPLGFADGQPTSGNMTVPDAVFRRVPSGDDPGANSVSLPTNSMPANLGAVTFTESGGNGNIDPGDVPNLHPPLRNYVTNPLHAATLHGATATLSTTTPAAPLVQHPPPHATTPP